MAVDLQLLEPGERLPSTEQIATAMDVSEITVRRALTSLATEGVLERRRGRNGGTHVAAEPRRASVEEIGAYREATAEVHGLIDRRVLAECGVAHLAALSASVEQVAALRELVRVMDRSETWAEFHSADEQFHLAVAAATGLPSVLDHYAPVLRDLYRFYLPYPIAYLRDSNREHAALVEALAARDPIEAVRLAREHVDSLHKTMFVGLAGDSG